MYEMPQNLFSGDHRTSANEHDLDVDLNLSFCFIHTFSAKSLSEAGVEAARACAG